MNYGLSETHFDVFNFVKLDKIATVVMFFIPFTFGLTGQFHLRRLTSVSPDYAGYVVDVHTDYLVSRA